MVEELYNMGNELSISKQSNVFKQLEDVYRFEKQLKDQWTQYYESKNKALNNMKRMYEYKKT